MLILIKVLFQLISIILVFLLVIFNCRRLLLSFTTFFFLKRNDATNFNLQDLANLPDLLLLLPCHNEEGMILSLSKSICNLNYPSEKLNIVWIDDGSQDSTKLLMSQVVGEHKNHYCMSTGEKMGKAAALNAALDKFTFGEIIVVFDADHRPMSDSLLHAVRYFKDKAVAGVSGRTIPVNPLTSLSSYYSNLENDIHQMVTMRAKDRLHLAPALLGSNCYYRRSFLEKYGKFRKGALLEDSDLTITFARAGYTTRFAEDVVSYHQVPISISDYLRQHRRWSHGFHDVSKTHALAILSDKELPILLRLELCLFSIGYLDRIAVLISSILIVLSYINNTVFYFPLGILLFALAVPVIQIVLLYIQFRMPLSMWVRIPLIPIFYVLDIYSSTYGFIAASIKRPPMWEETPRAGIEPDSQKT